MIYLKLHLTVHDVDHQVVARQERLLFRGGRWREKEEIYQDQLDKILVY